MDLAARAGAVVLAAGAGVVVYAGPLAGRGVISIAHRSGLRTTYEPVQALVSAGQRVSKGQPIGHLARGHPGCDSAQTCLHWGAHLGDRYVNPLTLLTAGAVRLLPWRTPP